MSDIAPPTRYDLDVIDPWERQLDAAGIQLSAEMSERLGTFLDLLLAANQRMNLTRIVDRQAAEIHHVADALTLARHIPHSTRLLADVGSGGGVPGMPLAIVLPEVRCVLIESTRKKAQFLREAAAELALRNVAIVDQRAEHLARSEHREKFDVVTARAVGSLAWLAEWCLPLARVGGKVLAMKGEKARAELSDAQAVIRKLGGGSVSVHPVELSGTEHHVIVEIPKIALTDRKYPRDPTSTGGKPLA